MLEIDVDVGRLLALLADEPLEQQAVGRRVDRGDPEAITDRAIGRAAAPLAQDRRVEAPREGDDVVDRQEIAREVELGDQPELVAELLGDRRRHPLAPPPRRPDPGEMLEMALRTAPLGHGLARIFIFELIEAEVDRIGEGPGCGDGVRPALEQPHHLGRRFQVPLGIGVEQIARSRQRHLLADAAHHVLQRAAIGGVVEHVVGGEDRQAMRLGHAVQSLDPRQIVAAIKMRRRDMAHPGKRRGQSGQCRLERTQILLGHGNERDVCRVERDFGQQQIALALGRSHLAQAEHPRQAAIAFAVDRVGQQRRRIDRIDPAPDQRPHPRALGCAVQPHHSGQRVAVGDSDRVHPLLKPGQHQLDRIRRPAQEREWRRQPKLDERGAWQRWFGPALANQFLARKGGRLGHQPNSPCKYQTGSPPRPSPNKPSR